MTIPELIEALSVLTERYSSVVASQAITNKQVYTAIRNYVANELKISNTEVRQMIEAGVARAAEAIINQVTSSQGLSKLQSQMERSSYRLLEAAIQTQVADLVRSRLATGRMTVEIKFVEAEPKGQKENRS